MIFLGDTFMTLKVFQDRRGRLERSHSLPNVTGDISFGGSLRDSTMDKRPDRETTTGA